jgi:integron integrase
MESKTKLLDQMRHVLRLKHMSIRTEKAYVQWAKRFILFHHKRHPADMGAPEIRAFLIHLAVEGQIAASTQNVALQALVFLYRHVLKQPFPELEDLEHAKKSQRVPVVFARQEVTKILAHLTGIPHLMASLLYGSGLRLMECVRLRVKDIDFAYHQLTVRDAKGAHDRVTMLPQSLEETLQRQLARTKLVHAEDLAAGYGEVYLPYAFARKAPHAGTSWEWQYVFPASKRPKAVRLVRPVRHAISACVSGWAASAVSRAPSGRRNTYAAAERNFQGGHGRETERRWEVGLREKWLYFSYPPPVLPRGVLHP